MSERFAERLGLGPTLKRLLNHLRSDRPPWDEAARRLWVNIQDYDRELTEGEQLVALMECIADLAELRNPALRSSYNSLAKKIAEGKASLAAVPRAEWEFQHPFGIEVTKTRTNPEDPLTEIIRISYQEGIVPDFLRQGRNRAAVYWGVLETLHDVVHKQPQ